MATEDVRLAINIEARLSRMERDLRRASGVADREFRAIERRAQQMSRRLDNVGSNLFRNATAPLAGLAGVFGTREIIRYADAWTEAGNKIRAASTAAGVNARSLDALKEGANEARTDLTAYVDLYARLIRSASGVAKSEREIATATDIVSKAFKAGGASAQEQAAGVLQLGQALGSGVLQGDELRSLRENAPILAQAIADEFGVTIAALKDLGAEGKLTSDRVFRAIINAQRPIEAQFRATNATIADSFTILANEFTAYIGNADASAGASRSLVVALQALSDNFEEAADTVLMFATLVISTLTGRALAGAVVGLGSAVRALGVFITAVRSGTLVAASFSAALGPIGLLAGAAAGAIFLLSTRTRDGIRSTDDYRERLVRLEEVKRLLRDASGEVKTALEEEREELQSSTEEYEANARAALANAKARLVAARAAQAELESQQDPDTNRILAQRRQEALDRGDRAMVQRHDDLMASNATTAGAETYRARENSFESLEADVTAAQAILDGLTRTVEEVGEAAAETERQLASTGSGFGNATQTLADTATKLASAPVETARRFVGATEGRDSNLLKTFFQQANHNIDPRMTAWCAAFVNAALAANGLPGTGSLSARSFLNYGEGTNDPRRGDIVVLSRGSNSAQGHVGFFEGYDERGNVRVLGGNQSNGVNVQSYDRNRVLGFRSIPGAERESLDTTLSAELTRREEVAQATRDQSDAYNAIVGDVVNYVAALNGEAAATGQTAEQASALRHEMDLLNQITAAGIQLTPQITEQVRQMAAGMAAAETAAENLGRAQQEMRDLANNATRGFVDDLIAGKSAGEAFAGVLDKIASKLLDMAFEGLFENAFSNPKGGGGGFLGSLVGGLFGGFRERGGPVSAGKAYAVGEKRPELFVPGQSGTIVPNIERMMRAPDLSPAGGRPVSNGGIADVRVFVDQDGNWRAAVERISSGITTQAVGAYDRQLGPGRTLGEKLSVGRSRNRPGY